MKRSLIFAGLVALAVLLLTLPAQAAWQEEFKGEAGLIAPVEREPYEIHNYTAAEEATPFENYLAEAGTIGPNEHESGLGEVMVAGCEENVFKNYVGEAGIVEPLDREDC